MAAALVCFVILEESVTRCCQPLHAPSNPSGTQRRTSQDDDATGRHRLQLTSASHTAAAAAAAVAAAAASLIHASANIVACMRNVPSATPERR